MSRTRRHKTDTTQAWLTALLTLASLAGSGAIITAHVSVTVEITPESARNGWIGDTLDLKAESIGASEFRVLAGPGASSEGAQVRLWDFAKAIHGGRHFPTFRQEIGDCVANGAANAVNYLQAVQLARGPPGVGRREFRPAHRPYIYGISRTAPDIGARKLGRSDGSVGAWAARAVERYGVLAGDGLDVPLYSGTLAREWGYKGVPQPFIDKAREFCVRTVAKVASYEDVRDALANGYPVTIASTVGFRMDPVVRDGKHWGRRSGSWAHQMCLVGVDDRAVSPFDGRQGAAYCLNSWGEAAHGPPADDAPPGGFWIDRAAITAIVAQDDSWAFSNFDGFPLRDLDFQVFSNDPPPTLTVQGLAHFPEPRPVRLPVSEHYFGLDADTATTFGGTSLGGSAAWWLAGRFCRRRRGRRGDTKSQAL